MLSEALECAQPDHRELDSSSAFSAVSFHHWLRKPQKTPRTQRRNAIF